MNSNIPLNLINVVANMLTVAWNDRASIVDCDRRVREEIGKELVLRGTRWNLCANSLPVQEHGFGPKHEVVWQYGQSNHPPKIKLAPWDDAEMRRIAKMWKGLGIVQN